MSRRRHPRARANYLRAIARKEERWGSEERYGFAKKMRAAPTSAEQIMWEWFRGNLTGIHFRRQAVVEDYVVDFYCGLVRIAVEVDGKAHDPEKDRERDRDLRRVGVETIWVPARKVYRDMGGVFDNVRARIFEILVRDEWRREKFLEHYRARWYSREQNKSLAVWELYDKLAAI